MKILIADDSPVLRRAVTKLLEREGYDVVTAEDGVEGITKFYRERPDLVLLDVQMPKLNGYVVCRLIKEDPAAATVPVLILTVRDSDEDRYWGGKSGADGYLTKEALGADLIVAIRSMLASRALRELSGVEPDLPLLGREVDVLTRVCEVLDRKLFEATVVNEIMSVSVEPVALDGTVERVLVALRRLVAFDAAAITLLDRGRVDLRLEHVLHPDDLAEFEDRCVRSALEFSDAEEFRPTMRTIGEVAGEVPARAGWGSLRSLPLRIRGVPIAVLTIGAHDDDVFTERVRRTLQTMVAPMAAVLDSARTFQTSVEVEARATFSSLF